MLCLLRRKTILSLLSRRSFASSSLEDFINPETFSEVKTFAKKEITPENERASKLEHEGILKLTNQILKSSSLESINSRDFKLAFNYWTSIRGHSQLIKKYSEDRAPHYALDLSLKLNATRNKSYIHDVIMTEESAFGGLTYLLEHLSSAFLKPHNQQLGRSKKDIGILAIDNFLTALEVVSSLMKKTKEEDKESFDYNMMHLYMWSKRAWFLNEFSSFASINAEQIENAFDGVITVQNCMNEMSPIAKKLLNSRGIKSAQLLKLYTLLVNSWVQSGLTDSLNEALNYLNQMEIDERLQTINAPPYNLVLYLCAKKQDVKMALQLWNRMQSLQHSPYSDIPDSHTLGLLLSTLVNANQTKNAVTILKESEEKTTRPQLTNTTIYNIVLDGISKSGSPRADEDALSILHTMRELSETRINPYISPDRITYSIVMEILSKCGVPARKIEEVLMECHSRSKDNPTLEPDWIMYNIAIKAYAKESSNSKDASKQAEMLLRIMTRNQTIPPKTASYNLVLKAYVEAEGCHLKEILSLFEEMKALSKAGNNIVKPDIITCNIVLNALTKDTTEESVARAEKFLREFNDYEVEADAITFNTLLNSMIKCGNLDRAKNFLEQWEIDYLSGNSAVKPDIKSYNILIDGYAKIGNIDACKTAEKILEGMATLALSNSERIDCMPDTISYTALMDAYARSKSKDSGEQAEKILDKMIQLKIPLNTICYNSAINCWAKSNQKDAPLRAEALLERMQNEYNAGDNLVKPDSRSYSSVMNCWAQSKSSLAAERASTLLHYMEYLAESGDRGMQPNKYSYTTVISAWGSSSHHDAVDKAIEILDRVEKNYRTGNSIVRANYAMYNAVINAIAKSKNDSKAQEALSMLERMKREFYQGGNPEAAPTTVSFSAVINACAYTTRPPKKEEAFKIARKLFQELLTDRSLKPNSHCYVNFITACKRLSPPGVKRERLIVSTFQDCMQRGLMNKIVLRTFENSVQHDVFQQTADKYKLR